MSEINKVNLGKAKAPTDPTIDIRSERFDPLKALYAENVFVPYKNAKVYDNVSKYEASMRSQQTESVSTPTSSSAVAQTIPVTRNPFSEPNEPIVRRFLPHQEMIKGTIKEKHSRNIVKKIEKGFGGPLDMLKTFFVERKRIKIYTRKEHGILGYITGFVESFDKHWNIALSDVYEVWKRKKLNFCDAADYGPPEDCSRQLKQLKIEFPKVTVKSLNRKYVECCRRVPQLLVRGEQVAVIMLDNSANLAT